MKETLWKNNLNFVNDVPITYMNLTVIVVIVSEKLSYRPSFFTDSLSRGCGPNFFVEHIVFNFISKRTVDKIQTNNDDRNCLSCRRRDGTSSPSVTVHSLDAWCSILGTKCCFLSATVSPSRCRKM